MTLSPIVFDARAVRRHRARAARLGGAEFLFDEVAERLVDRLDHVRRDFGEVLEIGARGGVLGRLVTGRAGIARGTAVAEDPGLLPGAGPRLVASTELLP